MRERYVGDFYEGRIPQHTLPILVVDCLYSEHVPPAFLVHPVIQAAMMATWKVGLRHRDDDRGGRIWRQFDALISPR